MPLGYNNDDGAQALDQQQEIDFRRGWQVVDADSGSNVVTDGSGAYEVDVAAGDINTPTGTVTCSAVTLDLQSLVDPDLPRIVIVYRDASGVAQTLAGTPAAKQPTGETSPGPIYQPAPDAFSTTDGVVLATVLLEAAASSVGGAQIRDRRMPASLNVDSAEVGSLNAVEGEVTGETLILGSRSSGSGGNTVGSFVNLIDGSVEDERGELDGNAEFSPDKDGQYEIDGKTDIRGTVSKGDELIVRLFNVTDQQLVTDAGGASIREKQQAENSISSEMGFSYQVELDSAKTYRIETTCSDNQFSVQTNSRVVISRSINQ